MKLSLSLRPNGIIKHSYQLNEAVEIYEASHYIDNNVKKEIANYILAKSLKKNLKILDAGIGGGDLVLLPLLDEMTEKKITAKIVGIDNSPPMLKRLDNALKQRGFSEISRNNEKIKYEKDGACKTEVEIYIYDLEEYSLPKDLNNEKFDIILSILTLHHLKNWRLVLSTLIKHLNKDGVFVIFEWTKGIKLRDGNFVREDGTIDDFSGIDPSIVNFWKEFYAKRKEYHAWCPEICASDYTMVKKVLRKLPFVEDSKEFEWEEKGNVNWSDIKNWIKTKAYSNFYRGLTKKEQEDLINWVANKIKSIPTNNNWTEKLGCRVTIFKYLDELENEKIEEIILSSLNETSIFPKLIWEEEKYENLLQFSVLIVQHDFITENTLFFTMNKWDMIENTWDKLDKPMIFNRSCDKNGEFLKSMLVYYAFIEKFNISVTDLIFRDLRYKPILIIRKNSEWSVKKYINTLGMIEKLEIDIPSIKPIESINFSVENINKEYYKPIKEDIFHVDFNAPEVKNCIQRIKDSISEDFFNTYNDKIEKGKNVLKNTLLDEESPLLPDDKNLLENFVKILLLHSLIILKWDTAVYIPAISLLPEKKETISFMSLGGIILFESNGNREDLNKKFLENRINVLKTVINLKFRSLGIAEYARKVKHETERHALRSAVAAIMARNMSHQQSSAVIPYLLSLAGVNDINKILTQYLSYIESRMDFVATAATMEFPKWGISVKFFKDLIVGLISQYGLIECLCKSEGYRYKDIQFKVYINDNEDLLEKDINTVNEKDVDVWIPGGFTGMHAFYLILENIMRNTAKYNKKGNELIVSIKLIEKDDSYIVQVWDNLSTETQKVEEFNKTFRESLIKPTGEKREYAWGFAEMRICATFLISGTEKEAAGKLSESEKCPIKAIEVNEGGQKRIGYEFKLKKPKLLEVYNES